MTGYLARHRMAVQPPNVAGNGRFVPSRLTLRKKSPTVFVAKLVLISTAIVLSVALFVTAPRTVTVPLATVLGSGLVVSVIVAAVHRWPALRRHADDRSKQRRGQPRGLPALREDGRGPGTGTWGWAAVGALSVSLLVLSLLVDEGLGAGFAAIGLAGLAVFRVAAMSGGWVRRSSIRAMRTTELHDSARSGNNTFEGAGMCGCRA